MSQFALDTGAFIRTFAGSRTGEAGSGDGLFSFPYGIAINPAGTTPFIELTDGTIVAESMAITTTIHGDVNINILGVFALSSFERDLPSGLPAVNVNGPRSSIVLEEAWQGFDVFSDFLGEVHSKDLCTNYDPPSYPASLPSLLPSLYLSSLR